MQNLTVQAGSTDVSVTIRALDDSGQPITDLTSATAGLALFYRREGATATGITESDLTALSDAHADGGLLHIGDGYYRLDVPDAAFVANARGVLVYGSATGVVIVGAYVQLVAYNPADGIRLGLTALPNAAADAAGGLPISDAGGLDLDTVGAAAVSAASTAAAIETDTQDIQSRLPAALVSGRIDASIGAAEADTITAAALAADASTEIAAAVFARAFSAAYNDLTFDECIKVMLAVSAGKASGLETTEATFRNLADNADVVVATVDADGNRTAVAITP